MAFASAAARSVYVTFTFAVAVVLWLLALIARKRWLEAAMFASAGTVALLCALPFLASLRGSAGGAAFVEFAVRPFTLAAHFSGKLGIELRTPFALTLANLVFLPLNYALELGFFLAVGVMRLRQLMRGRIKATANELVACTLVITSFLIGTFLRSSTTGTNDLGWRCFLPAQFILLLWGATLVDDWWFRRYEIAPQAAPQAVPRLRVRTTLATLLALGILGTAYQVFVLRTFPIFVDRGATAAVGWVDTVLSVGNASTYCDPPMKFLTQNRRLWPSCKAIQPQSVPSCTCYFRA